MASTLILFLITINGLCCACSKNISLYSYFDKESRISSPLDAFNVSKPLKKRIIHYGYSKGTVWITVKIKKTEDVSCFLELAMPQLDSIEVYKLYSDNTYKIKYKLGDNYPFKNRAILNKDFIVPFRLIPGKYVLKIRSDATLTIPIKVYTRKSFWEKTSKEYFFSALFYGFLFFISLWGFYSFIVFKKKAFLAYALFSIFVFLTFFTRDGFAYQFLWPTSIEWNKRSVRFFALLASCSSLFYSYFILRVHKTNLKYLYYILSAFSISASILILIKDIDTTQLFAPSFTLLKSIFISSIGFYFYFKKNKYAPYILMGGLSTSTGLLIYSASVTNFVNPNYLISNSVELGILGEFLATYLSLQKRIKEIVVNEEKSQKKLIELQKENEVNKAVATTTNMVFHDIRRPISKLKIFVSRIKSKDKNEVKKYVDYFSDNLKSDFESAERTLEDLMDIGSKRNEPIKRLDLNKIIKESYADISDTNIKFFLTPNIYIKGKENKIRRAFDNIISNAIEAPGDKKYYVESTLSGDRKWAKVVLGNLGGSPISEEVLNNVFKIFFTEQKRNGRGLGLAITKKNINDSEGKIWCVSNGYASYGGKIKRRFKDKDYVEFHIKLKREK